jgi:glycosyltransferase involved in cell wall biosynthesis
MVHISVVVPMFNEELIVDELVKRVTDEIKKISNECEIIIVDDGSSDDTWNKIKSWGEYDVRIKGLRFSRNFGHHYAISAGIHNSQGDWIVVMDGDLQDRPEVIPKLYAKALEGFDVVFVSRTQRPESFSYKLLQKIFYGILRFTTGIKFDSRQANFSIISKKVGEAFKIFPDNARFYGSTIKWLGFNTSFIEATHGKRFQGKPNYTFKKRIKLALDIVIAFSDRPLKFAIGLGLTMSVLSLFSTLYVFSLSIEKQLSEIITYLSFSVMLFLSGIIFTILGVIGIYLGRVFTEVKKRPLYIISEDIN